MSRRHEEPFAIGPYRVEERLGGGGMGEVFRAVDPRLGRRVALKRMRPDHGNDPARRRRFLDEARVAARLDHPSLVHIHDILEVDDERWLVLEYVDGERLDHLLESGPLPVAQALDIALDIARGIEAMHDADVLHRDLKAENIIVTAGPRQQARILDFGLALSDGTGREDSEDLPSSGGILGTPHAMSPEQARGLDTGSASDLFSFGSLLYEMLTGRSPFRAATALQTLAKVCHFDPDPADELVEEVPPALGHLVSRLLAKEAADRPRTATEVVAQLSALAKRAEPSTPGVDPPIVDGPISGAVGGGRSGARSAGSASSNDAKDVPIWTTRERRPLYLLCCELMTGAAGEVSDLEQLSDLLPPFQTRVHEACARYGGYLADLQGHRLVIYFGYPQAREDAARRALLAALDLAGTDSTSPGSSRVRAALHGGSAVVQRAPDRRAQVTLGHTLAVATAILERVGPSEVWASGVLIERLPEQVGSTPVEAEASWPASVPTVYRMHGEVDPVGSDSSVPLHGRDAELALLINRHAAALEGTGQGLMISAEAGLGKSCLLSALRRRLGGPWLEARCTSFERHRPLGPFASVLRQLTDDVYAGGAGDDDDASSFFPGISELAATFGLGDSELETVLRPSIDRRSSRDLETSTAEALERWLDLLGLTAERAADDAGLGALVLAIEDLQWADAATLRLAERLLEGLETLPMVLILTFRPEFQPPWRDGTTKTHLRLEHLDGSAMRRLIDEAGGSLTPAQRQDVERRADGHPHFARALVRHLVSHGNAVGVPAELQDRLRCELDRLGSARDLACAGALCDESFSPRELARLLPLTSEDFDSDLERLLDSGLWVLDDKGPEGLGRAAAGSTEPRFRFRHRLAQEAAREVLLLEDRRALEQRLRSRSG